MSSRFDFVTKYDVADYLLQKKLEGKWGTIEDIRVYTEAIVVFYRPECLDEAKEYFNSLFESMASFEGDDIVFDSGVLSFSLIWEEGEGGDKKVST